jgi:hypothetical protein
MGMARPVFLRPARAWRQNVSKVSRAPILLAAARVGKDAMRPTHGHHEPHGGVGQQEGGPTGATASARGFA